MENSLRHFKACALVMYPSKKTTAAVVFLSISLRIQTAPHSKRVIGSRANGMKITASSFQRLEAIRPCSRLEYLIPVTHPVQCLMGLTISEVPTNIAQTILVMGPAKVGDPEKPERTVILLGVSACCSLSYCIVASPRTDILFCSVSFRCADYSRIKHRMPRLQHHRWYYRVSVGRTGAAQ